MRNFGHHCSLRENWCKLSGGQFDIIMIKIPFVHVNSALWNLMIVLPQICYDMRLQVFIKVLFLILEILEKSCLLVVDW